MPKSFHLLGCCKSNLFNEMNKIPIFVKNNLRKFLTGVGILNKFLDLRRAILDKQSLERYLEKIASDHTLTSKSDVKTYPIYRLNENFEKITSTYNLLNEYVKLGIAIHPARRMDFG